MSVAGAGTSPSRRAACSIRSDEPALETCDASVVVLRLKLELLLVELARRVMFTRRTATFSATTPASSTANAAIQTMPPRERAVPARGGARRGRGARPRGLRGGGAATSVANQSSAATTPALRLDRGAQPRRRRRAGSRRPRPALGRIGRRSIARSSGSWPHTQTGKSGGHVQPRSLSRRNCLTMRSSSEWNEMTASRPPGRSISSAAGSAASSEPSSSLTAMRSAWKTRFAGWPSPKRAGAGIAHLIVSTSSPVRSNGCSLRRRTIARAICFA